MPIELLHAAIMRTDPAKEGDPVLTTGFLTVQMEVPDFGIMLGGLCEAALARELEGEDITPMRRVIDEMIAVARVTGVLTDAEVAFIYTDGE